MRVPWRQRGARASTHFVKVRGDNARPNGRSWYWYALHPRANLRNFLRYGRMEMWKYASLRSIVTNQSSDLICGTIASKLTFWTWAAWRSRAELEDLKWDATLECSRLLSWFLKSLDNPIHSLLKEARGRKGSIHKEVLYISLMLLIFNHKWPDAVRKLCSD